MSCVDTLCTDKLQENIDSLVKVGTIFSDYPSRVLESYKKNMKTLLK